MSIEILICIVLWLYVFGFIGIYTTQAVMTGGPLIQPVDWPSIVSMLCWPITVPLFVLLATYDRIRGR